MSGTPAASEGRGPRPDTIAAIATAPGDGAIGIVRLSGPDALRIAHGVFVAASGPAGSPEAPFTDGRRVYYGEVHDAEGPLDEVLLHVMRAPHSYTREDVVEINGHGGAGPVAAVLRLVLDRGARLAAPGEFTRRAFLNGRIDLAQAEAVMARIQAQTRTALRAATAAGRRDLGRETEALRAGLLEALARVEAAVDFPDEDLPELVDATLWNQLRDLHARVRRLLANAEAGRLLRDGARVAIAGRPNVGKSSLFNALLRDARAIVTEIPGTTRDLLEEVITLHGIPVRLTDTAGLRDTSDQVEQAGIAFANAAIQAADAVVVVYDVGAGWTAEDEEVAAPLRAGDAPVLLVGNKSDLPARGPGLERVEAAGALHVSAMTGDGLEALEHHLHEALAGGHDSVSEHAILAGARQREALAEAERALGRALASDGQSPEFLSIDLREAATALGSITGDDVGEDVLDRIFASFCIGK